MLGLDDRRLVVTMFPLRLRPFFANLIFVALSKSGDKRLPLIVAGIGEPSLGSGEGVLRLFRLSSLLLEGVGDGESL